MCCFSLGFAVLFLPVCFPLIHSLNLFFFSSFLSLCCACVPFLFSSSFSISSAATNEDKVRYVNELTRVLSVHASLEEMVLYPVLQRLPQKVSSSSAPVVSGAPAAVGAHGAMPEVAQSILEKSKNEHQEIKELLVSSVAH